MAQPLNILPHIGDEWEGHNGPQKGRTRRDFLNSVQDAVVRHINNRAQAPATAAAIVCNGARQSTGLGTTALQPSRYGEFQINARVTLNAPVAGNFFVYVYRSTVGVPAAGTAPAGGDVVVGSGAFGGGALPAGVDTPATVTLFDQNLNQQLQYFYYLAVQGPNTDTLNLAAGSQLTASEF